MESFFNINCKVELQKLDESTKYKTTIQGMEKETFSVSVPSAYGRFLLLHRGEKVAVTVFSNNERFEFISTVLGRANDKIPLYILQRPDKIDRVQSRDFVRIKAGLDMNYTIITKDDLENLSSLELNDKAFTIDISGGGALISTGKEHKPNDLIYMALTIPAYSNDSKDYTQKRIHIVGRIIRKIYKNEDGINGIAIVFTNIGERDRDDLIKYLFHLMRKQAKIKGD